MSTSLINVDNEHSLTFAAFPEFKVWIEIEGEPAKVYGVETKRVHGIEDNKSNEELHCAIEGKAGAKFAMHLRPFQFGSVPSTDKKEEAVEDDETVATVALKLFRCGDVVETHWVADFKVVDIEAKFGKDVLNEKDKKAQFAHSCSVGEEESRESAATWIECIDMEKEPFVQYIFTVWSRAGLEIKKYIEAEDSKLSLSPTAPTQAKKRTRSTSNSPLPQASNSKVKVAKKNRAAQEIIELDDDDEKPGSLELALQTEADTAIRRGKTLYIDFDEEEVDEAEKNKA
ncbi:hypothetical protein JCM5350_003706 [Sporobolomyces pararoseus]